MYRLFFFTFASAGVSIFAKQLYEAIYGKRESVLSTDAHLVDKDGTQDTVDSELQPQTSPLLDEESPQTQRRHTRWFRVLNAPDDRLFYLILFNTECALQPEELADYVQRVNQLSQVKVKASDPSVLQEWVDTGKGLFLLQVSNEQRLFYLHGKAKEKRVPRMMLGNGQMMVLMGLGPARVRELREVL